MATSQRNKQKKIAAKKAKRKNRQKKDQTTGSTNAISTKETAEPRNSLYVVDDYETGPIKACYISENIRGCGIGSIILARASIRKPEAICCALILVDTLCLGIKSCSFLLEDMVGLYELITDCGKIENMVPGEPETVAKLVQESAAYGASLGLPAPQNYQVLRCLLQDIEGWRCQEEFTFGRDGMPFYFKGPNDSDEGAKVILRALRRTIGEGHFRSSLFSDPKLTIE